MYPLRWNTESSVLVVRQDKYKKIKHINLNDSSDIKMPWELSRFHHFNTLGRAYWISGDEKYAKEFVNQLIDWTNCNPPRIGINWRCSMEVAIRLINWISAYFFFNHSPFFTNEIKTIFFKNILIHQLHIYHNLEFGYRSRTDGIPRNGNHFMTDLIGLVFPYFIFPSLASKRIYRKSLNWLYQEIDLQINPDGVHYELSIGYHRLITEILLAIVLIMKKNNIQLSDFIINKIQKMVDFVLAYTKPDGYTPQARDADNSRLISFTDNHVNDHRYLLNIGAVLFNRSDFKSAARSFSHEALWWLGPSGFNKFLSIKEDKNTNGSKIFSYSGFCFMKQNGDYLMNLCAKGGDRKSVV